MRSGGAGSGGVGLGACGDLLAFGVAAGEATTDTEGLTATVDVASGVAVTVLPQPAKASTAAAARNLKPLPDRTTITHPPPRLRTSFDLDYTQARV